MDVEGGCLCSHVRYKAVIDPARVAICHCADCQTNAATAIGMVASVTEGQFELLSGSMTEYDKRATSGRVCTRSFCPTCGTRIHARTKDDPTASFGLRWGTIAQRDQFVPKVQVWCGSAQEWVFDPAAIPQRMAQD